MNLALLRFYILRIDCEVNAANFQHFASCAQIRQLTYQALPIVFRLPGLSFINSKPERLRCSLRYFRALLSKDYKEMIFHCHELSPSSIRRALSQFPNDRMADSTSAAVSP
jgi:hypothetical protein